MAGECKKVLAIFIIIMYNLGTICNYIVNIIYLKGNKIMKKLQYLLVCILIFTIVACSSKNNDITNPISNANLNDNNAKIITTSYTIMV